ncbi:MAG TPA: hypothetical protein VGP16_10570 [Asanoa sp.]|jgi:hypothetical protein|nr:hypothetical protein [Asanoa sp.]
MSERSEGAGGMSARLVVSWTLIAILLGYGVVETAITAAKLFQ